MQTNRSRSLAQPHVVTVDGEVALSGSKSVCEGFAKMTRRLMRERGEKVTGRVVVAVAK